MKFESGCHDTSDAAPSPPRPTRRHSLATMSGLAFTASVGRGGIGHPADVLALERHLVTLGNDGLRVDDLVDADLATDDHEFGTSWMA
jgi:hypothetical protein